MIFTAAAVAALLAPALRVYSEPGLLLQFDRPDAVAGTKVRLRETLPVARASPVFAVSHYVTEIGRYDAATGRMVRTEAGDTLWSGLHDQFAGLPQTGIMHHGMYYDVTILGRKGTDFRFRPVRPGIYEFKAEWKLFGRGEIVTGPPVVLTVLPAPPNK